MKSQDALETRLSLPQEGRQRTALSPPEAYTLLFLGQRAFLVPQCGVPQEDTPVESLLSSDVLSAKGDRAFQDVDFLPL
jgi:hypothetical protein